MAIVVLQFSLSNSNKSELVQKIVTIIILIVVWITQFAGITIYTASLLSKTNDIIASVGVISAYIIVEVFVTAFILLMLEAYIHL